MIEIGNMPETTNKFGSYKVIVDRQVVVEYYRGVINVNDLIQLKKNILKDPDYNKFWNTIVDFRDCKITIKPNDVTKMIEYMKADYQGGQTRHIVLLANKPHEVAISTLYTVLLQESGLNFKSFIASEVDSIINRFYDGIFTEDEIVEIIYQLKTNSINRLLPDTKN